MASSTPADKPEELQTKPIHRDVTVIGAGWSGLLACKYMLEEGLSVTAIEKREDIGGIWSYSDDPNTITVMKSTRCTSSSTVTEMSDFPMPEEMGTFPHHQGIMKYLHSYAEQFNLMPHIKLNREVKKVEKDDTTWKVTCSNGEIYTSRFLVIATGAAQKPNLEILQDDTLRGFTGKIYHASEIKAPLEEHRGQRLLVIGGGETGSDICSEWVDHAQVIYWSIPRGQHFFRKYAKVVPWGKPQALDKASSRMMKNIAPYTRSKPGLAWICKWTSNGSLLAYQGHGIPEWKNDAAYFHFFINKNGKVLDLVDYEHIVPKGAIVGCNGREVTFADGSQQEFDLIILSTGYSVEYPYLPKRYRDTRVKERHKFVFDVEDPSIAFIGLVRPIVGSIVGVSELQARWAAKIYSNKVPLKPLEERREDVRKDSAYWNEYFKDTSQRIEGLVEAFTYIDDVARHAQIFPDYWSLFKRNPKHWFVAVNAPYNGATYRLNEPEQEEKAIATMQAHRRNTLTPVHLLLIVFLRLIWFDWILNLLGALKYRIQVASWWPGVRSMRGVQAVNNVWCLPKRVLFDKSSDPRDEHKLSAQQCKHDK